MWLIDNVLILDLLIYQGFEFENDESHRRDIKELQVVGTENLDLAEIEELIRLVYHVNGKITYIVELFDSLYRFRLKIFYF